jgi:serine/threonine protein kinase
MAPEQFQNRAGPQTDLYGLGATLLYVVSGCSPSSFPQKRLKVVFRHLVNVTPHLGDIIEQLLEPAPEDRFQSAEEAINALKGEGSTWMRSSVSQKSPGNAWQLKTAQQPAGTEVVSS